jgi:hypothetical protein
MKISVKWEELTSIKGAPRNPKDHDIGAIISSIERFGFVSPVIVNETTDRLVAGHGRLEALRAMWSNGDDMPKGVRLVRGSSPEQWSIPVIHGFEFATDEEAEAYLIADNRIGELGGWVEDELIDVLTDLQGGNSLDAVGYDGDDLDDIIKKLGKEFDPDAVKPDDESLADLSEKTKMICPDCGHEWLP